MKKNSLIVAKCGHATALVRPLPPEEARLLERLRPKTAGERLVEVVAVEPIMVMDPDWWRQLPDHEGPDGSQPAGDRETLPTDDNSYYRSSATARENSDA